MQSLVSVLWVARQYYADRDLNLFSPRNVNSSVPHTLTKRFEFLASGFLIHFRKHDHEFLASVSANGVALAKRVAQY